MLLLRVFSPLIETLLAAVSFSFSFASEGPVKTHLIIRVDTTHYCQPNKF